jgi:hypothetical protein
VVPAPLTVYSQGGYLGPVTEERYFFYVVPAFWLGTFAAVEDREVRPVELLFVAAGLALVYATIPFLSNLSQESAFLDPVESIVPHVLSRRFSEVGLTGLSMQDALAMFTLIAGAVIAWLWARGSVRGLGLIVGVSASLQLLLTGYAFAVIDGQVSGVEGRTEGSISALGWVDRHSGGHDVAWLANLSTTAPATTTASPTADQSRTTLFWNSTVRSWVRLPQVGLPPVEVPMAALPGSEVAVNPSSGELESLEAGLKYAVGETHSPFLQLQGRTVAQSPDGVLTLTRLAQPVRATWIAYGLGSDGAVVAGPPVRIAAFADGALNSVPTTKTALTALLAFTPPALPAGATKPPRTQLVLRLGKATTRIELTAGGSLLRARLVTCLPSRARVVSGTIAVRRSPAGLAAGALQSVTVSRGGACGVGP